MQDNGPLIAMIFFIVGALIFGVFAYMSFTDVEGDEANPRPWDAKIEVARKAIQAAEEENKKREDEVVVKREELARQRVKYDLYDMLKVDYELAYQGRRLLVDAAKKFRQQAQELKVKVDEAKSKTEKDVRTAETEIREKVDKDLKELTEAKEASALRQANDKKGIEKDEKIYRQQKNYEQSGLDEFKRQLDALTSREVERANVTVEIDGRVVLSDPVHNTIVIDRGTADGVRNGYRFECFTLRPGNRKVHKGFLEVRKAEPNLSECMVMTKLVDLPRDPLSDYTAREPEEQFSPFQESGKKGSSAQPLSASPKSVVMGMNREDPIVSGDMIQNPFYSPGKNYNFYIAGSKEIEKGVQKSAIAYPWPHIERVVQFYGGKVSKQVELGVDYIIAQKNPLDDPNYSRSVSLGIPVIYEWELFRFLDQK